MTQEDRKKAYLAYASVCFFWGTTYLAIRIGVEHLPPGLFAGVRFFLAGIIFIIFLKWRGYAFPTKGELIPLAIIGISLLTIANGSVVWAEQYVTSSVAALIVTTLPFFVVGFERMRPNGDKITFKKVAGILVGFAGVIVLLLPDLQNGLDASYMKGVLAVLVAPISWAAGSIYSKNIKLKTKALMAAAVQMIIAGFVLMVVGAISGEISRVHFNTEGIAALVYLVFFGSIAGYGSFIYALDKLPTSLVSTYAYVNPIVAVFLGWFILDERLDHWTILATVIILSGVALVKKTSTVS